MRASIRNLIAASALTITVGVAQAEISGNVSIGTDYRFRGISQTDRDPTIQGGFDYASESGLYAGTWMSNVTFGGSTEWDIYFGYAGEINEDLAFDVGYLYYLYPSDDSNPDLDYYEFYGSLAFGDASVGLAYSPDYFASTGDYFYLSADYGITLPGDFGLAAHLGYNIFDSSNDFASFLGSVPGSNPGDDYLNWSLSVSKAAMGVEWALSYIDTSISESECGGTKLCDATLVLAVSKSL